ncbi:MAG: hypothetical protein K2H14_06940 [Muribaculaceae bacterium]|nr:hypothetical protein [Muribaculaceae bacterium]
MKIFFDRTFSRQWLCALVCVAAASFFFNAWGQKLTWSIDFGSVFDNREGDNSYTPTETYFFTNLAPEIGVAFSERDRISGGVVWNQPIGREWGGARVSPTLYYRHEARRWSLSMGMFPRTHLHEPLPGFLWCDSLTYFQHNIRGVLAQYHSPSAFVDFYLDWRQMQTTTQREAFNIVFHGQWAPRAGRFFIGGHLMMNHYALVKHSPANQHIVDNFLVNPYVGVDLSGDTPLDSLYVRAGGLLTVERNRAYDNWTAPGGGWFDVVAEWRWLGVRNSLYAGKRLLPSYSEFRGALYPGEPFYSSPFYNRTDIYARIVRNRWVDLEASLDFNVARNSFIFYQRIMLRVYLDWKNMPLRRRR